MKEQRIPNFFAGHQYVYEEVSGGTGDTISDAVDDYFNNHADDEMNDLFSEEENPCFELKIYKCLSKKEAIEYGVIEEYWDDDWDYMIEHTCIDTIKYKASYQGFGIWNYSKQQKK